MGGLGRIRIIPGHLGRSVQHMQIVQSRINMVISHLVDLASGDVVQLVRTLPLSPKISYNLDL